jgi:hypothetical protein
MISILGSFLLAVVSIIVFTIASGGVIPYIFDPVAIMIMVFLPLFFQCVFYGKFTANAFLVVCKKDEKKQTWVRAYNFFKNYEQFSWLIAILFLLIKFVIDLIGLESRDYLGPHIRFMANLLIVTALLDLLIILPYKITIKKKLTQIEG